MSQCIPKNSLRKNPRFLLNLKFGVSKNSDIACSFKPEIKL